MHDYNTDSRSNFILYPFKRMYRECKVYINLTLSDLT